MKNVSTVLRQGVVMIFHKANNFNDETYHCLKLCDNRLVPTHRKLPLQCLPSNDNPAGKKKKTKKNITKIGHHGARKVSKCPLFNS